MIEFNEFRPNPAAPTVFVNRIRRINRTVPASKTDLRAFERLHCIRAN
jgi:hypothetical protein